MGFEPMYTEFTTHCLTSWLYYIYILMFIFNMLKKFNFLNNFYLFKKLFINSVCLNINLKVGDFVSVKIKNLNNTNHQIINGLIISYNNKHNSPEITLRKKVGFFGVTHKIFFNSPYIISIEKLKSMKVRRSKLFFTQLMSNKILRSKIAKKLIE